MDHHVISPAEYRELLAARAERDRLLALVNTPELVNFPKAVHLEAVHQLDRWGTTDRQGKEANDWFWLVGHLASRALEHHKEAERLAVRLMPDDALHAYILNDIDHHREKAVHHCITAAAALNHWHASMLGKKTAMQPGHAPAIAASEALEA
ncbi:MAG: hypothetical protein ABL916_24040 [Burkholderiaceae bacterium]